MLVGALSIRVNTNDLIQKHKFTRTPQYIHEKAMCVYGVEHKMEEFEYLAITL